MHTKNYRTILTIFFLVLTLIGCGGSSGSSPSGPPNDGAAGTATLTWDAPTTNIDGSPASLAGFKIYYGTSSHAYTQSIYVTDTGSSLVVYTLSLSQGTYYFAVTAVDESGIESDYSNEVSKAINTNT